MNVTVNYNHANTPETAAEMNNIKLSEPHIDSKGDRIIIKSEKPKILKIPMIT